MPRPGDIDRGNQRDKIKEARLVSKAREEGQELVDQKRLEQLLTDLLGDASGNEELARRGMEILRGY